MEYTRLTMAIQQPEQQELLAAMMETLGFEGFEFNNDHLAAFIPSVDYNQSLLVSLLQSLPGLKNTAFATDVIPETNWNDAWEKSYQPLRIGEQLYVRATFHQPDPGAVYEVVIDPKMSFGTGHHDTTRMMAEMLLENSPAAAKVLDFGSGTGILAILAAKMGASSVLAIDHEEWAYNNCVENIALNGVTQVTTVQGDETAIPSTTFDIVLANVNKNVILATIQRLAEVAKPNGFVYLSGLLHDDEAIVVTEAEKVGLRLTGKKTGNNWICLKMKKIAP